MRRFLLLFSLLAVALAGLGDGAAALMRSGAPRNGIVSVKSKVPEGGRPPMHCHAKFAMPSFGLAPRRVRFGSPWQAPGREPSPWPVLAAGAVPALRGIAPAVGRRPLETCPGSLPQTLRMICVLRI